MAKLSERNQLDQMTGIHYPEPIIVALDCLLKYAKNYKKRFHSPLASDGVLGKAWLESIYHLRQLLNGDGALAMLTGALDSKDNSACEALFWTAIRIAGFKSDNVESAGFTLTDIDEASRSQKQELTDDLKRAIGYMEYHYSSELRTMLFCKSLQTTVNKAEGRDGAGKLLKKGGK